jgi:hypothetical protein
MFKNIIHDFKTYNGDLGAQGFWVTLVYVLAVGAMASALQYCENYFC